MDKKISNKRSMEKGEEVRKKIMEEEKGKSWREEDERRSVGKEKGGRENREVRMMRKR